MDLTTITIGGLVLAYALLLLDNEHLQRRVDAQTQSADDAAELATERGEVVDDLRGLLRDLEARTAILHARLRESREHTEGVRSLHLLSDESPEVEVGSIQAQIARVLEATDPGP